VNIQEIDKWLDNEYGVSYTRLEELHDFVVDQDLKHREEKDKEIEKLTEELKNTKSRLKNVNNKKEHYKDVLRQIIHYCNYLRNDHKYSLNDGHIRKIKKICEREVGADDKI